MFYICFYSKVNLISGKEYRVKSIFNAPQAQSEQQTINSVFDFISPKFATYCSVLFTKLGGEGMCRSDPILGYL